MIGDHDLGNLVGAGGAGGQQPSSHPAFERQIEWLATLHLGQHGGGGLAMPLLGRRPR
jgi:hypothetical protein